MPRLDDLEVRLLAKHIKAVRKQKALTQEAVADLADLDVANYRRVENGLANAQFGTIYRIAIALSGGVESFFTGFPKS